MPINYEPKTGSSFKEPFLQPWRPSTETIPSPEDLITNYALEKPTAIEFCERKYPQMMDEFKKIQSEMYETFCKKQRNYGPNNISLGTNLETKEDIKLSLTGLWFRMNDKTQRLLQLVVKGEPDEVGENIQDTYEDLSVYGIIAQLVQRKKWSK